MKTALFCSARRAVSPYSSGASHAITSAEIYTTEYRKSAECNQLPICSLRTLLLQIRNDLFNIWTHSWNDSPPPLDVCLCTYWLLIIILNSRFNSQFPHFNRFIFLEKRNCCVMQSSQNLALSCQWVSDAWKLRWQEIAEKGSTQEPCHRNRFKNAAQTGYTIRWSALAMFSAIKRRDERFPNWNREGLNGIYTGAYLGQTLKACSLIDSQVVRNDSLLLSASADAPSFCCHVISALFCDVVSRLSSQSALHSRLKYDFYPLYDELSTDVLRGHFKLWTCNFPRYNIKTQMEQTARCSASPYAT